VLSNQVTWSGMLAAHQAVTFTFEVTHTGSYGDVVTNTSQFSHSSGSGSSNPATFTVVNPPAIALAPPDLNFGDQPVGSSMTQTISLANTGGAPLDIYNVVISSSYTFTTACPASLPVNDNCTIAVIFSPTSPGPNNGVLVLTTNVPDSPTLIPLSGTGIAVNHIYLPTIMKKV
jgi:hypothetical protein